MISSYKGQHFPLVNHWYQLTLDIHSYSGCDIE